VQLSLLSHIAKPFALSTSPDRAGSRRDRQACGKEYLKDLY